MRTYRASSDPLALSCPASTRGPDGEAPLIEMFAEAAGFGTAVHEVAAQIVQGAALDFDAEAARRGYKDAQAGEFVSCCGAAARFWREYGPHFPDPDVEQALAVTLGGVRYSGHPDVVAVQVLPDESRVIRVLDWKTTRLADVDYRPQMMRYLWLAWVNADESEKHDDFQYVIVYLRDRTAEVSPIIHNLDLIEYRENFQRDVVEVEDPPYRPGPHCTFCRRLPACPAHSALVRKTSADLEAGAVVGLPVEAAAIVDLYQRVAAVAGLCERFKEYARAAVAAAGGRLVGPSGVDLALVPSVRAEIDPQKAWPILAAKLPTDELAACVKIKKGDLLTAYAAKAPPKMKGKFKAELMSELKAAGAVTETEVVSLRAVRAASDEKALPEGEA